MSVIQMSEDKQEKSRKELKPERNRKEQDRMKKIRIRKGEEAGAAASLSNRTDSDFGEVDASVREIVEKVKRDGDEALYYFSEKFGGPGKERIGSLRVSEEEIEEACRATEPELTEALRMAAENIRSFHEKQMSESWSYRKGDGILLGQLVRPIRNVGVYIPGGKAPLSSSVLMNVIPAKIAGCERIVMCSSPEGDGKINKYILAAAKIAGVDEIYKAGGAQAIAAMAYGTESIRPVSKITGPGSAYVARAKKYVFGTVDIDMIAGPSEVCIIADSTADPEYIAADMLAQAEHDEMASSILITDSEETADRAAAALQRQISVLERREIASQSVENNAVIFVTEDLDSAFLIADEIAPEHLELMIPDAEKRLDMVNCAGAVFLGQYSPEPLGDYLAGPNHTLPTGGTARFASPLGVYDFLTRTSVISYSREELQKVNREIIRLAESEELTAHANAVRVRFGNEGKKAKA